MNDQPVIEPATNTTNTRDYHSCLLVGSESTIQGIRWLEFYNLRQHGHRDQPRGLSSLVFMEEACS